MEKIIKNKITAKKIDRTKIRRTKIDRTKIDRNKIDRMIRDKKELSVFEAYHMFPDSVCLLVNMRERKIPGGTEMIGELTFVGSESKARLLAKNHMKVGKSIIKGKNISEAEFMARI